MFIDKMKTVLNIALKYNLKNINSYDGYDDADILKLEFNDKESMLMVRNFSKNNNIKTNVQLKEPNILYIIFEKNNEITLKH